MKILTFTFITILNFTSHAADMTSLSINELSASQIPLANQKGSIEVKVRENSANFGKPYAIEIFSKCVDATKNSTRTVPICDVKPASIKESADGKFLLAKIRETDSELFNQKTRAATPEELISLEPDCKTEATELMISLEKFCL